MHITNQKKLLYDILKKTNLCSQQEDQWLPGKGVAEYFQGSENTLYDTIMMDMCHYTFVKTHRTTPRVNPKINYGLSVILMCQSLFILGNKYTILVSDLYNQGGYACVCIGGLRKFCVPPS